MSRNVPTPADCELAVTVARTRATACVRASMRKKPRLVVIRKSPVAGSMSSALTYGGFGEKSTSRPERFAPPSALAPHPGRTSAHAATAITARMRA